MFLAIAVVGIAGPLIAAHEQSGVVHERATALALARQLLGEIASKPLLDQGTSSNLGHEANRGESDHTRYDSADDYHGYSDTTAGMRDLSGNVVGFADTNPYTRAVTVEYRATIAGPATTAGDFALVTVTVTSPRKAVVKVSQLLTRHTLAS